MDSNSGRFPLEFLSFNLDMSSEERAMEDTTQHSDDVLEEETNGLQQPNETEKPAVQRVLTVTQQETVPTSGSFTDGSVSVYIGKTLEALGGLEACPGVTFLRPTPSALDAGQEEGTPKESESMELPRCSESPQRSIGETAPGNTQLDLLGESGCSVQKVDCFQTDTSEVERGLR